MTQRGFLVRGLLAALAVACLVFSMRVQTQAAWRMEAEAKTASKGQTGLTMAFKFSWDIKCVQFTMPIVVRQVEGGAFWTGTLPYDTADADGNRLTQGVTWYPTVPPWAAVIYELRPGPGCENSGSYDGVSPDHFAVSAQGMGTLAAQAGGVDFVTLQFDVNTQAGQFEFDTACFSGSLNTIFMIDGVNYVDHGPGGTNEVTFVKGTVTIPPGNQSIQIESRTVPTSSTGVQLGVKIANDDALQHITLPLVCRNVSGGAFWTNMPTSLDTLPWTGRLTSALVYVRTVDKTLVDGVSPDPFVIEAYKQADPALDPGPSQKMIPLVFDVNGNGGSFEIDTAFFPPDKGLKVETVGNPGLALMPGFSKGTVILVPPDTGNKVEISTITVQAKKKNVILNIKISTAQKVNSLSIPLRARTVSGGAFWAANFDTLSWGLTPPNALTTDRELVKQLNFDYNSPDDFLIRAKADLEPCLDAGTHPAFLSVRFDANNSPGVFEIDTVLLPPMHRLTFGVCDQIKWVSPSFIKGVVIINPCDCSRNGDLNCDGYINPLDVVYLVDFVYQQPSFFCNPGNCSQNGDLTCDGLINPVDVVRMVKWIYQQGPGPCDPCTI